MSDPKNPAQAGSFEACRLAFIETNYPSLNGSPEDSGHGEIRSWCNCWSSTSNDSIATTGLAREN
jgi:hypothetical protein